jgi:Rho-binding antiterminator
MTKNISCDAHDYFEIVCMRRSQVKVTAKDNKYCGIATDIKLVKKQEYLLIKDGINTQQILLSDVKQLEAIGNSVAQHNFSITW